MIELFKNPNYDFIGKRKWAYIVSIALTLISLSSLAVRGGLRYDIDFTGGTLIQVRFDRQDPGQSRHDPSRREHHSTVRRRE
jgi:preprotein translocase subunit SecF